MTTSAKQHADPDDAPLRSDPAEPLPAGALPTRYHTVVDGVAALTNGGVIDEATVSVYVNGEEVATVMCSPLDQTALALGFLFNEHVIESLDEVRIIQPNPRSTAVDVYLHRTDFSPPRRMLLTSGCGGGITWQQLSELQPALDSPFITSPAVISARMRDLLTNAALYNRVRGVHTAILADSKQMLLIAEDVGRHNTIDKLAGKALQQHLNTRDKILISSGRISSEMLGKARRMGIPVVVSRTAPTSTALRLAHAWNLCVVGYVRGSKMQVYTHAWRLGIVQE